MVENNLHFSNKELATIGSRILGISGENEQEKLIFSFDTFIDGTAYLEVQFPDPKQKKVFIELTKVNQTYQIEVKNSLLICEGYLKMQLRIAGTTSVWKSKQFEMLVLEAVNAIDRIDDDYPNYILITNTRLTNLENNKVDKVTGKGLSTNDYTTAEKQKLAGIEAQANKTVVDSSLSSSSTNPVQNKKVKEALDTKENTSNKVTSISSSSTNTQYPSAKLLYDKLAEKQEQIDALVEENSTLKKQQLKGQATGSSIQLTDSAEGLEIENVVIKGATEQAQYEGKNLYNVNTSKASSESTIIYDDYSVLTINNTGSSTRYTPDYKNVSTDLQTNTDYWAVIEIKAVSGEGQIYFFSNLADSAKGQFITTVQYSFANLTAGQKIKAKVTTRDSFDGCTSFARKIAEFSAGQSGSITYRISVLANEPDLSTFEYEPYVGGQPAPNPDYPQLIHRVTGNCGIRLQNINLLDLTQTPILRTSYPQQVYSIVNDTISVTGSPNQNSGIGLIVPVEIDKTLTISYDMAEFNGTSGNNSIMYDFLDEVPTSFETLNFQYYIPKTKIKTCIAEKKILLIFVRVGANNSAVVTGLRVNYGSTATAYIPHAEQNAPLSLGNIEAYEGDEIEIDYVQKAGYKKVTGASIIKKWKKYTFTGNEVIEPEDNNQVYKWALSSNSSRAKVITSQSIYNLSNIYSNIAVKGTQATTRTNINQVAISEWGTQTIRQFVYFNINIASSVAECQQVLASNYIVYELETPETTPITDTTLLNQLETLINMKTYKQITNIDTTGSDLAPVLEFQYSKDLQTVIDNMQAQILA